MGEYEPSPVEQTHASLPSPAPEETSMTTRAAKGYGWGRWLREQFFPALLAFFLGLAVGYILWHRGSTVPKTASGSPARPQPAAAEPQNTPTPVRFDVSEDDDPALGPADAKVVLIEFGDYQCPFCKRWRLQVFDPLMEKYGDQIRYVYRDFPLTSIHPEALPAAIAANCAGEQGKYWEYHDKLFKGDSLGHDVYLQYAKELGLDMDAFQACLQDKAQEEEVMKDFRDGLKLGVQGTPTFFINGAPVVGAQPLAVFEAIIAGELGQGQ